MVKWYQTAAKGVAIFWHHRKFLPAPPGRHGSRFVATLSSWMFSLPAGTEHFITVSYAPPPTPLSEIWSVQTHRRMHAVYLQMHVSSLWDVESCWILLQTLFRLCCDTCWAPCFSGQTNTNSSVAVICCSFWGVGSACNKDLVSFCYIVTCWRWNNNLMAVCCLLIGCMCC